MRRVYGEHALLRSAALLAYRDVLTVPDDIAPLVQAGYGEEVPGPASWHDAMRDAEDVDRRGSADRRERAAPFPVGEVGGPRANLDGWVRAGVGDADADQEDPRRVRQVRDGAEPVEVLVVQRDRDGGLLTRTGSRRTRPCRSRWSRRYLFRSPARSPPARCG